MTNNNIIQMDSNSYSIKLGTTYGGSYYNMVEPVGGIFKQTNNT